MKNIIFILLYYVLITTFMFNFIYAQEYAPESLVVEIFSDGKAAIEYRLGADVTIPTMTIPLFGTVFEQLIVIDENGALVDSRIENGSLVVDTFGASHLLITYNTDIVNKTGRLWTFVLDAPMNTSIKLPEDSVIIGLSQLPNSIRLSDNRYALVMPKGHNEISYVIGALGTKEHATVAISEAEKAISTNKIKDMVVDDAELKLNESKQAFDNRKYADAEILANDARTLANNTNHNAMLANTALGEAEIEIMNSNVQGFNTISAEQIFNQAAEEYVNGNYDEAFSLAQQAKEVVLDARNVPLDTFDQTYVIIGVIVVSAAVVAVSALYIQSRRSMIEKSTPGVPVELLAKERRTIDLTKIFTEKPYLRDDDKEALNFIAERGGEAFESEIRERFDLPKTTVWRLVKRLEREELVEVKKAGGQNLIRIREEFTKTEQNSAPE